MSLNIYAEKSQISKKKLIFLYGLDSAQEETRPRSGQNEIGPELTQKRTYLWLDSTQPRGVGWCSSPKQINVLVAGYSAEHSNQWIIIRWLLNCSRSACKWRRTKNGQRRREGYLQWGSVVAVSGGLWGRRRRLGTPVILLPNVVVMQWGPAAPVDGSSPPESVIFFFCFVSTLLASLFLFYFLFFRFVHSFSLLCFCFPLSPLLLPTSVLPCFLLSISLSPLFFFRFLFPIPLCFGFFIYSFSRQLPPVLLVSPSSLSLSLSFCFSSPLFCSVPPSFPKLSPTLSPSLPSLILHCSLFLLCLSLSFLLPFLQYILWPEDAGVFICCCRDRVTAGVHGGEGYQPWDMPPWLKQISAFAAASSLGQLHTTSSEENSVQWNGTVLQL